MTAVGSLSVDSWPDLPPKALVLVPVGSTEQHGPHLPFDTDTRIAAAVVEGVARRLSTGGCDGVVIAPAVQYGSSGEHQDFPGTVSIGSTVFEEVIVEATRSISTWAARTVFVNAHGGNAIPLAAAVRRMSHEGHTVCWWPCSTVGDAHAGHSETSIMLHLAPDYVRMSAAVAGNTRDLGEILGTLSRDGVRSLSPSGVLGNPTTATASVGAELLEAMVANTSERILLWMARSRVEQPLTGSGG